MDYKSIGLSVGLNLLLLLRKLAHRAAMLFSHEPVNRVVRVPEKSDRRAVRSNAVDVRSLARAGACPRNIEFNNGAMFIAHKAVIHI